MTTEPETPTEHETGNVVIKGPVTVVFAQESHEHDEQELLDRLRRAGVDVGDVQPEHVTGLRNAVPRLLRWMAASEDNVNLFGTDPLGALKAAAPEAVPNVETIDAPERPAGPSATFRLDATATAAVAADLAAEIISASQGSAHIAEQRALLARVASASPAAANAALLAAVAEGLRNPDVGTDRPPKRADRPSKRNPGA